MIKKIKRLAKRYAFWPERRDSDGGDQKHGRNHGQGALGNHMNSFSVLRSAYRAATCSA